MIEPELTLLEMKIKGCLGDTVKFHKSLFCIGPECFNAIYMLFAFGKFILSIIYKIMLFVSQVNQTIVTAQGLGMNDDYYNQQSSF
jgi:hypothetical protein